jgi:hypothetical protein
VTVCPRCDDTGLADSGGSHPWGEPISIPCDCKEEPDCFDCIGLLLQTGICFCDSQGVPRGGPGND